MNNGNNCAYCGKPLENSNKKFCSRQCAGKSWGGRNLLQVDETFPWKKVNEEEYECRYNVACVCRTRQCSKCGWNPAVAEARKKKEATA